MGDAKRQREYRRRKGARVGDHPGPAASAPCGTVSAYKRHKRHGEPVDDACREAYNAAQRGYYRKRQAFGGTAL